jgi:lysozyme family protein
MSTAFHSSLPFVLQWEGGFVNHPADPGGATNKGVTQKVYDGWRARQGQPPRTVRLIEEAEVHAIYHADYWIPPRCDVLERQLDLVQFDTAVNMGVGRAVRLLQKAAGCDVDGAFGPGTQQAVEACTPGDLLTGYCDAREAYYRLLVARNAKLGVFLKGWLNRLNALRQEVGLAVREMPGPDLGGEAWHTERIPDVGVDARYDVEF